MSVSITIEELIVFIHLSIYLLGCMRASIRDRERLRDRSHLSALHNQDGEE